MKDNKLIAEFMGYTGGSDFQYLTHPETLLDTNVDELLYHTSWDWLMPVVRKIEMECEGVPPQLLDCSLYSEIGEVYQAVVEFIKEYNK